MAKTPDMTNTTPSSITTELLALPEVNFAGISNSLVVRIPMQIRGTPHFPVAASSAKIEVRKSI